MSWGGKGHKWGTFLLFTTRLQLALKCFLRVVLVAEGNRLPILTFNDHHKRQVGAANNTAVVTDGGKLACMELGTAVVIGIWSRLLKT